MEINLTQGKFAIVDKEDFDYLNQWKWYFSNSGYAVRSKNKKKIYMHKLIVPTALAADHINGDRLDNRRSNLREATQKQNCQNRRTFKEYKGVYKVTDRRGYYSCIYIDGKSKYLGYFSTRKEAALAYESAAVIYFGEYKCVDSKREVLNGGC